MVTLVTTRISAATPKLPAAASFPKPATFCRFAWINSRATFPIPTLLQVYPERFAQEALEHNSKAVHRAYAKRALMKLPSLQDYEERAATKIAATV